MDIDVEHEGQRTKVTPPSQSVGGGGDVEMDGGDNEGSKVSHNDSRCQLSVREFLCF